MSHVDIVRNYVEFINNYIFCEHITLNKDGSGKNYTYLAINRLSMKSIGWQAMKTFIIAFAFYSTLYYYITKKKTMKSYVVTHINDHISHLGKLLRRRRWRRQQRRRWWWGSKYGSWLPHRRRMHPRRWWSLIALVAAATVEKWIYGR